jgi:hypothetical protein
MADELNGGGTVVTDPAAATGASPDVSPPVTGAEGVTGEAQVDASEQIATLNKRIDDLRSQDNSRFDKLTGQMGNLVTALQSNAQSAVEGKTKDEQAATRAALAQRITDGEVDGAEMLQLFDTAVENAVNMTDAKVAALQQVVDAQTQKFAELNPQYQAHKDEVDKFMADYGMSKDVAIKFAVDHAAPKQPETPTLPSNGTQGQPTGEPTGGMTDAQIKQAVLDGGGNPATLTAEDIATLKSRWEKK